MDETELGAPSPSAGARTIKSGSSSPGKTAALVGFSATNVDTASNALLWARYSGAATFRSFGSVPPNPDTIFKDGITTQAAFTKACLALASSPSVTEFNAECTGCEQDVITAHPAQYPDGQQT